MTKRKKFLYYRQKVKDGGRIILRQQKDEEQDEQQDERSMTKLKTERIQMFIGNLDYNTFIDRVVKYLESHLQTCYGISNGCIGYGELIKDHNSLHRRSKGFGFITLNNQRAYQLLLNDSQRGLLFLEGRQLRCKPPDKPQDKRGNQQGQLDPLHLIEDISLQIGNILGSSSFPSTTLKDDLEEEMEDVDERRRYQMLTQFTCPSSPLHKQQIHFVSRKLKLMEILFPFNDQLFKVSISLRRLDFIQFYRERAGSASRIGKGKGQSQNVVMVFMTHRLPFLYKYRQPLSIEDLFSYSRDANISKVDILSEKNWIRCLDPVTVANASIAWAGTNNDQSPLNIFNRCKVYRIVIKESEVSQFLTIMKKLHFLQPGDDANSFPEEELMPIAMSMEEVARACLLSSSLLSSSNGNATSSRSSVASCFQSLNFDTRYILECLQCSGKIDLVSNILYDEYLGSNPGKSAQLFVTWLKEISQQKGEHIIVSCMIQLINDKTISYLNLLEVQLYIEELLSHEAVVGTTDATTDTGSLYNTRRIYITPLQTIAALPEREQGNRILEDNRQFVHRFVRVNFVDENLSAKTQLSEEIYEQRFKQVLENGVRLAGRHFIFLAYSNSQLKQHSCWFYDDDNSPHELDPRSEHGCRGAVGKCSNSGRKYHGGV